MPSIKIETGKPLRDYYDADYVAGVGRMLHEVWSDFEPAAFSKDVFGDGWLQLELKGRMGRLAEVLDRMLPDDFDEALGIMDLVVPQVDNLLGLFVPALVELRVCRDFEGGWESAALALARYTGFATAEFAVRPMIIHDQARMLKQMLEWARMGDEDLRRLASEGSRPRLPWAMALPALKRDPAPLLPILEQLRNDEAEYVRRSVANNLNDIAKDHPDLVLQIAERWLAEDTADPVNRKRMVKHACRTLLKQGRPQAMALFGFRDPSDVQVIGLELDRTRVQIGTTLQFSFQIQATPTLGLLRVEYAVHYVKANGTSNAKIFKISEFESDDNKRNIERKHSFRDLSTRRHHPGTHAISIAINGVEKSRIQFEVTQ